MIKVVINNRNRLTTTKNMVEHLLRLNPKEEIIILDNDSTYPPLLEWYEAITNNPNLTNRVQVMYLPNHGHLALWAILLDRELGDYFIYTDSDIELNENFPQDWKEIMLSIMNKYNYNKVALSLKIDDLPDHYMFKNQVIRNESHHWLEQIEIGLYISDTDTTFALMRNIHDNCYTSIRIGWDNFVSRHIPWYHDIDNLSKEERYYLDHLGQRQLTQYSKQHKNPELYDDK